MCTQGKTVSNVCKSRMENMSKSVNVNNTDHVKAEVILGQGHCRPVVYTRCDAQGRHTGDELSKNVKNCIPNKYKSREGEKLQNRVPKRVFYNTSYSPTQIESLLVRPLNQNVNIFKANAQKAVARSYASVVKGSTKASTNVQKYCKGGVFWASKHLTTRKEGNTNKSMDGLKTVINTDKGVGVKKVSDNYDNNSIESDTTQSKPWGRQGPIESTNDNNDTVSAVNPNSVGLMHGQKLLFDIRNTEGDKFINSIIFNDSKKHLAPVECAAYDQWRVQSKMNFGFIPLTDPILPSTEIISDMKVSDPVALHEKVKSFNLPNYLGARIPVKSQMNIQAWKSMLKGYWDQQLIQCLEFGFPLGFNRQCPLKHEIINHKSAIEWPQDVKKYIDEEKSFGAIIGPFPEPPIANLHYSPFMTRHKPNSDSRRVILDLSWPRGESVNAGVEKDGYLGADFKLTFPSIDDLTRELVKIGKGAHIFKVDVSRAFRHLNVDPRDYDLLGLSWDATYIDTRIPFGSRHGSQFFQRTSDAVRHVMRQRDVNVINYIDDFLGYGTPDVARRSYDALLDVMTQLGITVSEKKLVPPTTRAVCLGILIDTVDGTVAIPPEKLQDVKNMVNQWKGKKYCTKRELQSLLGTLLYIHKCVKPARCFLNRMLETLRKASNPAKIILTDDFRRDLGWFDQFLPHYNGISMYAHKVSRSVLELDACLTGLGGRWQKFVYHLPIVRGFRNLDIVHLEMINIILALRLFAQFWTGSRVLIKCDNDAVVKVLSAGKARDPYLGACARNVWYIAALADIDLQYVHVLGKNNVVADLLSRWQNTVANVNQLQALISDPVWLPVSVDMLEIDHTL